MKYVSEPESLDLICALVPLVTLTTSKDENSSQENPHETFEAHCFQRNLVFPCHTREYSVLAMAHSGEVIVLRISIVASSHEYKSRLESVVGTQLLRS